MKAYEYNVIFEPAEEGGYLAHVPALNGLTTQGETLDEAVEMVKDAIKCFLETCRIKGLPIPEDLRERQPVVRKMKVSV